MKTEAIKESILRNYKIISQRSKVTPEKEHIRPVWGLVYKNNGTRGFVSEFGIVERNKTKIDIVDGEIKQVKKPFWMTWKRALKKINNMMENINENLDNENVVTKNIVNILCFPKDFAERISKINERMGAK